MMLRHLFVTTAVALALSAPAVAQQGQQQPIQKPAEQQTQAQPAQTGQQQPSPAQEEGAQVIVVTPEGEQQAEQPTAQEQQPAQQEVVVEEQPAEEEAAETAVVEETEEGQVATAAPAAAGEPFIVAQEVGQVRADRVLGKSVVNPQDESVGDINDLVFDEEGRLVAAVIGVGGFLGLGQKNVAVSWDQIEWTPMEDGEVELSMPFTREELEEAPDFKDLETQRAEEEAAAAQQQQPTGGMAPAVPAAPTAQ